MRWYEALHVRARIVDVDPELGTLALWNGSETINIWAVDEEEEWHPMECVMFDGGDRPEEGDLTIHDAIEAYHRWRAYQRSQEEE